MGMKLMLGFLLICLALQWANGRWLKKNWVQSFDRTGWSTCPYGYIMKGFWKSRCQRIHCIEYAYCYRNSFQYTTRSSYNANWVRCLDRHQGGWCTCYNGYYLTGLYRSGNSRSTRSDLVHNIEYGKCHRLSNSNRWGRCYVENVQQELDINNNNVLSLCRTKGFYLVGLYKSRNCDHVYCIEALKCCTPSYGSDQISSIA